MERRLYSWLPRAEVVRAPRVRSWGTTLVAALLVLATACSRGEVGASLEERAQRYWELKQGKQWAEIWDAYLDPELKEKLPKDAFLKRRQLAFDILGYALQEVKPEEEDEARATVVVTSEVNVPLRGAGGKTQLVRKEVTTSDTWVRRGDRWFIRLSK